MEQRYSDPEVITRDERIARLQDELAELGMGGGPQASQALMKLLQNPSAIRSQFNLSPTQAANVKALISGAGTAAAVKYLSTAFGTELSAIMGAAASAFLARRIFG